MWWELRGQVPGGRVGVGGVAWLQLEDQLGGDSDVEDAAPQGVGAGHDLVELEVDEVPDALAFSAEATQAV